jgi:adenylate cyclase
MKSGTSVSLRVSVLLIYIALTLPPFLGMLYYAYERNTHSMLEIGDAFIDRAAAASIQDTSKLISQLGIATKGVATLGHLDAAGLRERTDRTLYYLYEITRLNESIYAATISFADDGMFIQVVRMPPGLTKFGVHNTRPPEGTKYVANVVRRNGATASSEYRYFSEWGKTLLQETWPTTFDPRTRPFYIQALGKTDRTVSDVFALASTGKPGLVIAQPFFGENNKFVGLASAVISLDNISAFLKEESEAVNGKVFIIAVDGMMIAHPEPGIAAKQDGSESPLIKAVDSKDPLAAAAVRQMKTLGKGRFYLKHGEDKREYAVSVVPISPEVGKPWLIVTIVPTDSFLASLTTTNQHLMIIGAITLTMAMLIVIWLARRITWPIYVLKSQADRIRSLMFSNEPSARSAVSEIQGLTDAMMAMEKTIRSFGTFVPRELVRQLLAGDGTIKLGGDSKHITIFFSDVVGFSTLAENLPARDLLRLVSASLEAVAGAVMAEHGTVDKYIGDSVMAFWGAPVLIDDHAYLACVAALRAQIRVEQLNAESRAKGEPELHIRIGLHTDTAIVGTVGSVDHMNYTVMGDGVNVASRLEGINKDYGTQICVSHQVFREAGDRLWLRPIDTVVVKGRRESMTIYELVGVRDGADDIAASADQQETCKLTTEAFMAFKSEQWDRAHALYSQLIERDKNDKVARSMLDRCRISDG